MDDDDEITQIGVTSFMSAMGCHVGMPTGKFCIYNHKFVKHTFYDIQNVTKSNIQYENMFSILFTYNFFGNTYTKSQLSISKSRDSA